MKKNNHSSKVTIFKLVLLSSCVFSAKNISQGLTNKKYIAETYQASIKDESVIQLMETLDDSNETNLNFYATQYFSNLEKNFPVNSHGSCSYVAVSMLLSFYDSYWYDEFIDEDYDQIAFVNSSEGSYGLSSNVESPGVKNPTIESVLNLSDIAYETYISSSKSYDFQSYLIDFAYGLFDDSYSDYSDSKYGLSFYQQTNLIYSYLVLDRGITTNIFTMDNNNYYSQEEYITFLRSKIQLGIPVLVNVQSSIFGNHTVIAYDCDNDNIYAHTGWKSSNNSAYTHVSFNDLGIASIDSVVSLDMVNTSWNPENYKDEATNETIGVECFACPYDIQVPSQANYDIPPSFSWKSLYNEKWFDERTISFRIQFLLNDDDIYPRFGSFLYSTTTSLQLNMVQWSEILDLSYSSSAKILITCFELRNGNFLSDLYTSSAIFSWLDPDPVLYQITPVDYDFQDAYPTDDDTKNNYITHNLNNGLTFRTRRYRTAYIQNEYIIMSPISDNIPEMNAYIEYSFKRPIKKMEVDLTMWMDTTTEILTSSNGKAYLQIPGINGWDNKLDLLSASTALPTDRTQPKTYTLEFETPVYSFRFYTEYNGTTVVDGLNRGRICIGNIQLYLQRNNYMPLNWSELEYEPDTWNECKLYTNCYAYALNIKDNPDKISWAMQPGQSGGKNGIPNITSSSDQSYLVEAVKRDSKYYGFKFEEIGKHEACSNGCYKVALVVAPGRDYHWYRQNLDGTWSHKPSSDSVRNYDDSGYLIYDPSTCDRTSSTRYPAYTMFIGFFEVTPLG